MGTVRSFARWALSAALLLYLGIHLVKGQKPSGSGVDVALYVVMGIALMVLLITEPMLRDRRPTLHAGRLSEGGIRIWREPPVKPLLARQKVERQVAEREIEVGRRAIRVGAKVLTEVASANAVAQRGHCDGAGWDWLADEIQVLEDALGWCHARQTPRDAEPVGAVLRAVMELVESAQVGADSLEASDNLETPRYVAEDLRDAIKTFKAALADSERHS